MLFLVAVKTFSRTVLGVAALGAVAGCGGGNPLKVGDGGSAGQGIAGKSGTAGVSGSAAASTCTGLNHPCPQPAGPCEMLLDEKSCAEHPECKAMGCSDCHGGQNFVGCTEPDGGVMVECGPCPPVCSTLDETSCKANDYCHPAYCPDCNGGQKFESCLGPNEHVACSACPTPLELCIGLDEMSCQATPACAALYCPNCNGGQRFLGCGVPGEAVGCATCPAFCDSVTTLAACDARPDCHSVFADLGVCDCATPGCCIGFARCTDGGKAACKGFTGTGGITVCAAPHLFVQERTSPRSRPTATRVACGRASARHDTSGWTLAAVEGRARLRASLW
jgi:hypothetical protein